VKAPLNIKNLTYEKKVRREENKILKQQQNARDVKYWSFQKKIRENIGLIIRA
jgi:hypothetical protein